MSKRDIISAVLFWLGLLSDIGGMAVLMYFNSKVVIWSDECDRVTAVIVIGLLMMAASIALDLLPRKGDKMVTNVVQLVLTMLQAMFSRTSA